MSGRTVGTVAMPRDWTLEVRRFRAESCEHVHGEIPNTSRMSCPQCVAMALRRAYEAGLADARGTP